MYSPSYATWSKLTLILMLLSSAKSSDIFKDHYNRMGYGLCTNCTTYPYTDYTGPCPKTLYSAKRVVENCSSLNLAAEYLSNWTTLFTNPIFVTELILQDNNFRQNLPYTALNTIYVDLKFLDLSRNYINEFTTDLQLIDCSVSYLNDIDLSWNSFSKFPLFSFTCMNLLQRLRLSYNRLLYNLDDLTVFNMPVDPHNTNKLMPNLQILDLSYCSIQTLNQNGFTILKYFPNLLYLNLMGNQIKYIYENPFIWTPFLQYLSIDFNLIECKLQMRWLKYYLINNKIQLFGISVNNTPLNTFYSPTCFNVLTQTNESIISLDDDAFYTDIYLSTKLTNRPAVIPVNITIRAGNTIDLDCSVYSVPPSSLWWTFNDRVLSKTVTTGSPYQFIESFNDTYMKQFNKTSTLRIKNIYEQLGGTYSCNAFYLGYDPNPYVNISSIGFNVKVLPNPNGDTGSFLSPGAIAGIVIGSILGFLLLCLLLFCCIFCCCYRRGLCCFKSSSSSTTSSSSSSSNLYKKKGSRYNSTQTVNKKLTDMEENASGFKDINRTKPNYVINTISKGSVSQIANTKTRSESNVCNNRSDMYQDSAIDSWRILPTCTTTTVHHAHQATNYNNMSPTNDVEFYTQTTRKVLPSEEVLLNCASPSRVTLNKGNQAQEGMQTTNKYLYDETLVYNVNNPGNIYNSSANILTSSSSNMKSAQPNQPNQQIYTLRNQPSDYIISASTNKAFINDNSDANSGTYQLHHPQQQHIYSQTNLNENFSNDLNKEIESYNRNNLNQNNLASPSNYNYTNDNTYFSSRANNANTYLNESFEKKYQYGNETLMVDNYGIPHASNQTNDVYISIERQQKQYGNNMHNTSTNSNSNLNNVNGKNGFMKYDSDV